MEVSKGDKQMELSICEVMIFNGRKAKRAARQAAKYLRRKWIEPSYYQFSDLKFLSDQRGW